jgi:hypothetical protein
MILMQLRQVGQTEIIRDGDIALPGVENALKMIQYRINGPFRVFSYALIRLLFPGSDPFQQSFFPHWTSTLGTGSRFHLPIGNRLWMETD